MSKHTPGPWEWGCEMPGHDGTPDMDPAPYEPAQVHLEGREDEPICWISPHFSDATEANACLIAAAPDLLTALRAMHDAFCGTSHNKTEDAANALAEAALAKAEAK